jgi:carboxymethylenebutenolidase
MDLIEPLVHSATVHTRTVTIDAPDGPVTGLLAIPDGDAWTSAVVVVPDRGGVDEHIARACRDLAAAGHVALAIDLAVSELHAALPSSLSPRSILTRFTRAVTAGLTLLRTIGPTRPSRLGVIGYGAGGLVAFAAGYRCQVGAAIAFYGEGPMHLREHLADIIEKPKPQAASFLCLVGAVDEHLYTADLGAILRHFTNFRMQFNVIVYPRVGNGFCLPGHPKYRPAEAKDAWGRVLHALESSSRLRHRFVAKARLPPKPDLLRSAPRPARRS